MSMDLALQTFMVESSELLQDMEDCLLGIDASDDVQESVNSIFRAAHTIKGSAGLFGLDALVDFTHVVESILNDVRNGETELDDELVGLMLECKDCIGNMVGSISDGRLHEDTGEQALRLSLLQKLEAWLEPETAAQLPASVTVDASQEAVTDTAAGVANGNWHISVHFGPDVLRNGMDPLSFLRFLGTIGSIRHIVTLWDALPAADAMDPESCYLGYEINFESNASKTDIENVFEFVREDCRLHIVPPHSRVEEYIRIIESSEDEGLRLGEILVQCGTLTRHELEALLQSQRQRQAAAGEHRKLGELVVEEELAAPEVVIAALGKQERSRRNVEQKKQTVRVEAARLDQLINLIGELVISGAGVETGVRTGSDRNTQLEATANLMRLIEEVRESALNLRMVQIGETFNRFQRVVRDVSKELGKSIELQIIGADTELDKTVVEKISDPLMHLVRNSMDHGIEAPELRLQRGKPAVGLLELNAYHERGSIVIEVSDDGGGINTEKVLAKARAQGLVAADAELSEHEICQLIFEPGFSTADKLSNISGRGVGMDVVRRNIEALRGSIEIDSVFGSGTTMRIRLPLTLAIIDGFMMKVGSASYVVPLDIVEECIELNSAVADDTERRYIDLRGEALPYIRLGEFFSQRCSEQRRENIVVVRYGSWKAGLVVDELVGEFQTVIKPLGSLFSNLSGISGSTILGSGEVALILDAPALIQQAIQGDNRNYLQAGRQAVLH
jgi:two-component system chemotaxis sensor kinase CheA